MDFLRKNLNEYKISFIKQEDFEHHVSETIKSYDETLNKIDLLKFNENVIDPIKLTFDKYLFNKTWDEIVELEIHRQRDKSNNNSIGYFHQNLFSYIKNCVVPSEGFDVIYKDKDGHNVYVEMKNKHNTMNSSSSQRTYIKFQHQILTNPDDRCYLVEIIAPRSRDIVWEISIDGNKCFDERIRRLSIDHFYKEVTGLDDAFYQICTQLPITIEKLVANKSVRVAEKDTVVQELKDKHPDFLKSLYLLAFGTYLGFDYEMDDVYKMIDQYLNKK